MEICIIGLGRMGGNIAQHLLEQDVRVVAYNRSKEKVDEIVKKGAVGAYSLEEIPQKLQNKPMVVVLYVPAGNVTETVLFGSGNKQGLAQILPKGSIIIDGGNSFFKDSQRRHKKLADCGFHFLDMGTSGGLEGARTGACLMVGGEKSVYKQVEPVLASIATKDGYGYFGLAGSGHYVKMIHNAVEYGMMGAIAEGMNLIFNAQFSIFNKKEKHNNFHFDLAKVAKVWAHGSIVSGLLMDKAQSAFEKDGALSRIAGEVPYGETEKEIEWLNTIEIDNPVIQQSRKQRVETRKKQSFIGKVIAALRNEFGGHKPNKP